MALGEVLARLSVELGLNSAAFETGAKRAGAQADALGSRMEKMGNRVGTAIKAFAASAVAAEVGALIKRGLDYASALGEQAQQLGVTTDALQEYRYAATQVGISQEAMDASLAKLTKSIGEAAAGGKKQAAAFAELGVAVKDTEGNILDAGAAIPLIADGLSKMESSAERARIETTLFGKSGQQLDTLLAGGSGAVNNLRDAAHKLGVVLSEQQIQNADDTADKLAALKTVLEANIAGAVANNANAILQFANALAYLAAKAGEADAALALYYERNKFNTAVAKTRVGLTPGVRAEGRREIRDIEGAREVRAINSALGMNLNEYLRGGRKADASLGTPVATGGGGGKARGGGGRSGPSAAEIERRFEDRLLSITQNILSLRQSMVGNAEEEAEIALRRVEWDRLQEKKDVELDEHFTQAQKAELLAANERRADAAREQVDRDKSRRLEGEAADVAAQQADAQRERLQLQMSLADTDGERQRIAFELLEIDQEEKRNALDRIIHSGTRADAEKALAQAALDQLNANAGLARQSVGRANETQAQAYLRSLQQTPEQLNEAIDGIRIDGLEALNEGIVDAIMGAKSLAEVFSNVANQIIADLARIAIRKAIIEPLANSLFGGGTLSGVDYGALTNAANSVKLPGFATGTGSAPRGLALVGERGPELVNFRGGERVFNTRESSRMGGGNVYNISGNVLTPEMWAQIQAMDVQAANAGANGGVAKMAHQQSRRLG